jgi:hypothetical protein
MIRLIKQPLVLLLPTLLLLTFATCVVACEEHATEASKSNLFEIVSVTDLADDGCCSIGDSDRAVLAERWSIGKATVAIEPWTTSGIQSHVHRTFTDLERRHSKDPPFRSFSPIRI